MARFSSVNSRLHISLLISLGAMLLAVASKLYQGPFEATVKGNAGDTLVVLSLHFFIRALYPKLGARVTAAAVFGLGAAVEICQAAGVLDGSLAPTANYWLGHRFDLYDLVAYAVGAVAAVLIDSRVIARGSGLHREAASH